MVHTLSESMYGPGNSISSYQVRYVQFNIILVFTTTSTKWFHFFQVFLANVNVTNLSLYLSQIYFFFHFTTGNKEHNSTL